MQIRAILRNTLQTPFVRITYDCNAVQHSGKVCNSLVLNYEPLLYQLSYVGTSGGNIASTGAGYKRAKRLAETRL
jgi:hypothetical protein